MEMIFQTVIKYCTMMEVVIVIKFLGEVVGVVLEDI